MAAQAQTTQRKARWSAPRPKCPPGPQPQPYRRRRPENTTLHRIVRENLESYLAQATEADPMGDGVPDHVENEFRSYLRCGILAHIFPHVPVRQFVLSVPKRLRPYLHHRPKTATAVLHIVLRALQATLREASPTSPPSASLAVASFLHRFGSSLNPHFHYHLAVVDGLFERINSDQGSENPTASLRIEATDRTGLERLIRYCARPPFALERLHLVVDRSDQVLYRLPKPDPAGRTALRLSALEFLDRLATILPPPRIHRHSYHGAFAPNAPMRPLITARTEAENAAAAADPVSQQTAIPKPAAAQPRKGSKADQEQSGNVPGSGPSPSPRPSKWAALLARIYEVFPPIRQRRTVLPGRVSLVEGAVLEEPAGAVGILAFRAGSARARWRAANSSRILVASGVCRDNSVMARSRRARTPIRAWVSWAPAPGCRVRRSTCAKKSETRARAPS